MGGQFKLISLHYLSSFRYLQISDFGGKPSFITQTWAKHLNLMSCIQILLLKLMQKVIYPECNFSRFLKMCRISEQKKISTWIETQPNAWAWLFAVTSMISQPLLLYIHLRYCEHVILWGIHCFHFQKQCHLPLTDFCIPIFCPPPWHNKHAYFVPPNVVCMAEVQKGLLYILAT